MFGKISTIVLVAFITTVTEGKVWDGLTASFSFNTSEHFYQLPQTLKVAITEGWISISGVNPPDWVTALSYQGDPTVIILFANDKAVGIQISIPASGVDPDQPLQWGENTAIITKTIYGEPYYTATAYFHNDESEDIRKLWFQEKNGLSEIPTIASQVPSKTSLLLKNCYPTMGTHYYAWHPLANCTSLYPWLLLADEDDVVGFGLQGFGTLPPIGNRIWWETIPAIGIYVAVPDPPQCAVDATATFGAISLHVWFVDKPQAITCS